MSEYQYYEFRAIDHPLTNEQKEKISALSSRAYVTSHSTSFVYNYSDFRGNTEQLMSDYFDVMLYMANWGSRRLMFRIPCLLIDMKQVMPYCISEEIDQRTTKNKKHIIVDLEFDDEDQSGWAEGEGWLDDLVELRKDLIQGDFRILYLAWLKAAKNALAMEDIDKDTLEPPVPPGLGHLSPALKTFITFFEIDEAMIEVAERESEKYQKQELEPETWIQELPHAEQHDFLVRLSRDEKNLSALLNRRLHQLAGKTLCEEKHADAARRTIKALIDSAEICRLEKKEQEKRSRACSAAQTRSSSQ